MLQTPEITCPFIEIAKKFGLEKADLQGYLVRDCGFSTGGAKNLANALWKNKQPKRDLTNLARFLEARTPYDIKAIDYEHFLAGKRFGQEFVVESTFRKIEGLYEIYRQHASINSMVIEYLAIKNGVLGYLSYNRHSTPGYFVGSLNITGKHIYFHSKRKNPYSEISGITEMRGGMSRIFPGIMTGLDDFGEEMISCKVIALKISNKINDHYDFKGKSPRLLSDNGEIVFDMIASQQIYDIRDIQRYSTRLMLND